MRSKAHYHGQPIHPALIPFPFAFLVGAFAFHLAGLLLNSASLSATGSHLAIAGIVMGLIAACQESSTMSTALRRRVQDRRVPAGTAS
jgi:uncharacterized membrane protein